MNHPEAFMALPSVVNALGSESFFSELSNWIQRQIGYDSTIIILYPEAGRPSIIYNGTDYFVDAEISQEFINVSHVLDPFYRMVKSSDNEGVFLLADVAPDEFYESEFYNQIYVQTGLQQELGILLRLDDHSAIEISVGLRKNSVDSSDEVARIQPIFETVKSLICKHFLIAPESKNIGLQLADFLSNFGKEYLSSRECEVLRLVLQGYSTKGMAPLLNVSAETIKVYRKRLYAKLKISSQSELFSLFLEAAATMPVDSSEDPLVHYFQ